MKPTMYIDVLIALNFLMNSLIIYITSKFLKHSLSPLRLALTSMLGALYAAAVFLPSMKLLYTILGRIGITGLLCVMAFSPKRPADLLKSFLIFIGVSFCIGGACFACVFLSGAGGVLDAVSSNGVIYFNLNLPLLIAGTAIGYAALIAERRAAVRNLSRQRMIIPLTVRHNGAEVEFMALIDTGSELCAPITGESVIAAEKRAAEPLLKNLHELEMRDVPYEEVGGAEGRLKAFKPDLIYTSRPDVKISHQVLIAPTDHVLSRDGLYDAIISPDAFTEQITSNKNKQSGRRKSPCQKHSQN